MYLYMIVHIDQRVASEADSIIKAGGGVQGGGLKQGRSASPRNAYQERST